MNESLVLAIDQGTSSTRVIAFDREGVAVASARRSVGTVHRFPGWVEQDAIEILRSVTDCVRECIARLGARARHIRCAGITNQRETTIIWDRASGLPIHPAIVWQSQQSAEICAKVLTSVDESTIRLKTGLLANPYFSASKIRWILENVPEASFAQTKGRLAFGTVESWLVWNLTARARHVSDMSNASRTLLFNIGRCDWDTDLLSLFGVDRSLLPELVGTSGDFGSITADITGAAPIPITACVGDQQASLFGQKGWELGRAKSTCGTGCFLMLNCGNEMKPPAKGLLTTIAWQIAGKTTYALEGSILASGSSIAWQGEKLGARIDERKLDLDTPACESGLVAVPAFTGLGAPHWDPAARAAIYGLTLDTNQDSLYKALIEAIAFQSKEILDKMREENGVRLEQLVLDGGGSRSDYLCQFHADMLGMPVARSAETEATALGAALLAGLEAGVWESRDELERLNVADKHFTPRTTAPQREKFEGMWARAVSATRQFSRPHKFSVE